MTSPELAEAITEHWGERCSEYDPGCFCCRAWDQFDAVAELQKRLGEVEKPCAICQRKVTDAIGDDWCTACDADERLHAAKAANDALAATIARMVENAALAERIKESSAKVVKGVWADHERQFAAEKLRAESAEAKLAAVRALAAKAINDAYNPSTSRSLYAINEIVKEPSNA